MNKSLSAVSTPPTRLTVLDGLRGLAVALVVILHLHAYVPRLWDGHTAFGESSLLGRTMSQFWIGVDLFFVLSGFFIGLAVLRPAQWNPWAFAKSRLTRIMPAYYVSMLVVVLLLERDLLTHMQGWANIGLHVLMLHSMQRWAFFGINGPYWTLGIEFAFYLWMLAFAPLLRARQGGWLLLLMLLVCLCWRLGLLVGVALDQRFFFGVQLPGMLDEFAFGIAVALLYQRGLLQRWLPTGLPVGLGLAFAGTVLVMLCLRHYLSLPADSYWTHGPTVLLSRTILAFGFALLVTACLQLSDQGWLIALVRYSGLSGLGKISYSMYLYHVPVILLLHSWGGDAITPGWGLVATALAVMVAVSWASYRWIEKRCHPSL